MQTNDSIIQKIREKSSLFSQLVFVIHAFALMVLSSTIYVRNMLKIHLSRIAMAMLTQTKLEIESELVAAQTTLDIVSNTVRNMILREESAGAVFEYIKDIDREMNNKMGGFMFNGFFAYFEVFGDVFFHSGDWEAEENYNAVDYPWYKAAVEAGDKIAVTPIYLSSHTGQYVVTYSQRIFSNEGQPLGVVCLNVPLDRIRNIVVNMQIAESGYGVL